MLSKVKTLNGYNIRNVKDETIGTIKDFYFDDRYWTLRYLIANTGSWLTGRKVLISPYAVVTVNADQNNIVADLTKQQIEDSPTLESDKPVSQQYEESYYGYYNWPQYWGGPYSWGNYPLIERNREKWVTTQKNNNGKKYDHHLRSCHEVTGYKIEAEDGEIGHVEDFIIETETWEIRYLVVNTSNWWAGEKVLISPLWIERVSWSDRRVVIDLNREAIKHSPEFDDHALVNRDYETSLYGHYNRKGYWIGK